MKKYLSLIVIIVSLFAISACVPKVTNNPPKAPHNPYPADKATGIPVTPTLSWEAEDPDKDPLTYDLFFGTSESHLDPEASDLTVNQYTFTEELEYNTKYYWKVKAKDGKGGETEGPVWSFTTQPPNTPPTAPHNPSPETGETGVPLKPTLSWEAEDPDEDPLTYDLFFGTSESHLDPEASDLTVNQYTFTEELEYNTKYYWKVIAKDDKGLETEGPVWNFTTQTSEQPPNTPPTAPHNPSPETGETGVPLKPTLSWEAEDPDEDPLTYDLFFGTSESHLDPEASDLTVNQYTFTEELEYNTKYYWKVIAKDDKGLETEGPVWNFTTMEKPLDIIDDLEDLESDDELYIITSVTDKDINELTSKLINYVASFPSLETLDDYADFYNGIIEVYSQNPDAVNKLKAMIESSDALVDEKYLSVEIIDEALESIISALNELVDTGGEILANKKLIKPYNNVSTPEVLIFDYRDLMYLRLITGGLLTIYESQFFIKPYIDIFEEIREYDDIFEYFLISEAYEKINTFISKYTEYDTPWKKEDFWQDLDELISELSEEDGDDEYVSFSDLFKDDVLQLPGTDFIVEKLNFFVSIFKKVYDFEKEKANENGWTDDDQLSLYEYFMTLNGLTFEDNISIKNLLDIPLDNSDFPTQILELKFGSTSLLDSFTLEDLLTELYNSLPNGQLNITAKINTPAIVEGTVDIDLTVEVSLTLDFNELMNEPLDLMVNNIKVQADIIEELIEIEIWEKLSSNNMTQEDAEKIYNIVLNNLGFYDPPSDTLTVNIDEGSIIAEIKIDIDWEQ